jgi:hypothetical protein
MAWTPEQLTFARAWSAALLAFGKTAFVRGTVTDVVAWSEGGGPRDYIMLRVAFVGDGMKVARAFGYFSAEGGENLDLGATAGPISYAAGGILKAKEMARDLGRDKISLADLLDRINGQAAYEFCDAHGIEMPFTETSTSWIIEPGYPWPADDQAVPYWSAKKQKLITPERPAWLIHVENNEKPGTTKLGVNPCLVFPPEPRPSWALWGRAGKQDLIVAHSMTLLPTPDAPAFPFLGLKFPFLGLKFHKHLDKAIENIRACGGLLFPSLSIGEIPASNFGPITLVGHLGLVLDGLKPFKERGRDATSWVYAHDAWTVTTGELMRDVAARLFDELHGHEDYMYGHHIWSIGPPSEWFGGPTEGSTPVTTVSELVRAVKRRGVSFKRGMSREAFVATNEAVSGTADKYAYCEAKARRVISLSEFPLMIGPDALAKQMHTFAKGVGYEGEILFLPDKFGVVENDMADDRDYRLFQWSWLVADAIKRLAEPMEI